MRTLTSSLLVLFMLMWCRAAAATTWYVAVESLNPLENGSQTAPYKTISAALAVASSGDTIEVGPGVYSETVTIDTAVTVRGAPELFTTIRNQGDPWVLAAPGARLEGLRFRGEGSGQAIKGTEAFVVDACLIEGYSLGVWLYAIDAQAIISRSRIEEVTTGVFLYNSVGYSWIHNNVIIADGGSSGIQTFDSQVHVFHNLISGFLYPVYFRNYTMPDLPLSYIFNNQFHDAYRAVNGYNIEPGQMYVDNNVYDATYLDYGLPTGSVGAANIAGLCGGPADWNGAFDWGFVGGGECIDIGWLFYDDDGSPADAGPWGGGAVAMQEFLAAPVHYRFGVVILHEGSDPEVETVSFAEDLRDVLVDNWADVTAGTGRLIGDEVLAVECDATLQAELDASQQNPDIDKLNLLGVRITQQVMAERGDVYDYLTVVLDDNACGLDTSAHRSARMNVRYLGKELFDASADTGSKRMQGWGFLNDESKYWIYGALQTAARVAYHETFGHRWGVALPVYRDGGHWHKAVSASGAGMTMMHAVKWLSNGDGTVSAYGPATPIRYFHDVMLYAMGGLAASEFSGLDFVDTDGDGEIEADFVLPDFEVPIPGELVHAPSEELLTLWGGGRVPIKDFVLSGTIEPTAPSFPPYSPLSVHITANSSLGIDSIELDVLGTTVDDTLDYNGETSVDELVTLSYSVSFPTTRTVQMTITDIDGNKNTRAFLLGNWGEAETELLIQ